MTVREYARSLADQNLSQTQMYDKIRAYSNSLKSKEQEVKKKDSQTADPSSESSDNTGSKSETGSSVPPGQTLDRGDGYEYKFEMEFITPEKQVRMNGQMLVPITVPMKVK